MFNLKKLEKRTSAIIAQGFDDLLGMFNANSLMIRSIYQGAFFYLLRSNKKHKEVQTMLRKCLSS